MTTRRRELDLTLGDVASAIGVSPMDVSGWALGETVPNSERLVALAEVFQVPADQLASMAGVELDGPSLPEPAATLTAKTDEPEIPSDDAQPPAKEAPLEVEVPDVIDPVGEEPSPPVPSVNLTPKADEPEIEIPAVEPQAVATPVGAESSEVLEPPGEEPFPPETDEPEVEIPAVEPQTVATLFGAESSEVLEPPGEEPFPPETDEPEIEIPAVEPQTVVTPVEVEPSEITEPESEELTEPIGDDLVGIDPSAEEGAETDEEPGVASQVADIPDGAEGSGTEPALPTAGPEQHPAPTIPAPLAPAAVKSAPAPVRADDPPSFVTPEGRAEQLSNVPLGYVQDSRMMLRYRIRWALTTVVLVIMFFIGLWASRELIDALSLVFEAVTP